LFSVTGRIDSPNAEKILSSDTPALTKETSKRHCATAKTNMGIFSVPTQRRRHRYWSRRMVDPRLVRALPSMRGSNIGRRVDLQSWMWITEVPRAMEGSIVGGFVDRGALLWTLTTFAQAPTI
jgi:hypothetical protein